MTKDCDSQITKRHVTVHPKKIKERSDSEDDYLSIKEDKYMILSPMSPGSEEGISNGKHSKDSSKIHNGNRKNSSSLYSPRSISRSPIGSARSRRRKKRKGYNRESDSTSISVEESPDISTTVAFNFKKKNVIKPNAAFTNTFKPATTAIYKETKINRMEALPPRSATPQRECVTPPTPRTPPSPVASSLPAHSPNERNHLIDCALFDRKVANAPSIVMPHAPNTTVFDEEIVRSSDGLQNYAWPAMMIQYTSTSPSINYSVNPLQFTFKSTRVTSKAQKRKAKKSKKKSKKSKKNAHKHEKKCSDDNKIVTNYDSDYNDDDDYKGGMSDRSEYADNIMFNESSDAEQKKLDAKLKKTKNPKLYKTILPGISISNKWSTSSEDEEELQPLKTSKPLIVLTSKSPVKKTYSANASPYSDYYRSGSSAARSYSRSRRSYSYSYGETTDDYSSRSRSRSYTPRPRRPRHRRRRRYHRRNNRCQSRSSSCSPSASSSSASSSSYSRSRSRSYSRSYTRSPNVKISRAVKPPIIIKPLEPVKPKSKKSKSDQSINEIPVPPETSKKVSSNSFIGPLNDDPNALPFQPIGPDEPLVFSSNNKSKSLNLSTNNASEYAVHNEDEMEHYKTLVEQSKLHIQSRIVDQQQHSNPNDENTEAEVEPIDLSEHEVQSKLVTEADLIARQRTQEAAIVMELQRNQIAVQNQLAQRQMIAVQLQNQQVMAIQQHRALALQQQQQQQQQALAYHMQRQQQAQAAQAQAQAAQLQAAMLMQGSLALRQPYAIPATPPFSHALLAQQAAQQRYLAMQQQQRQMQAIHQQSMMTRQQQLQPETQVEPIIQTTSNEPPASTETKEETPIPPVSPTPIVVTPTTSEAS